VREDVERSARASSVENMRDPAEDGQAIGASTLINRTSGDSSHRASSDISSTVVDADPTARSSAVVTAARAHARASSELDA